MKDAPVSTPQDEHDLALVILLVEVTERGGVDEVTLTEHCHTQPSNKLHSDISTQRLFTLPNDI